MCRVSAGVVTTVNGLNGLEIESLRGKISRILPDRPSYSLSFLQNDYLFHFKGLRRLRHDLNHPSAPSAEVKERVELYLKSPSRL